MSPSYKYDVSRRAHYDILSPYPRFKGVEQLLPDNALPIFYLWLGTRATQPKSKEVSVSLAIQPKSMNVNEYYDLFGDNAYSIISELLYL